MPKVRGRYKQYNWDNEREIPVRTKQRRNHQILSATSENCHVNLNKTSSFETTSEEYSSINFETLLRNEPVLLTNSNDYEYDQSINLGGRE